MTHPAYRQSTETNTAPDLLLLEFHERGSDQVVDRAVLNNEDVVFEDNTFVRAQFECHIPGEGDVFSSPTLAFSNVSRIPGRAVLAATDRIVGRMIHVDGTDFTIVGGVRNYHNSLMDTKNMLVISDATVDHLTVSGSLGPAMSEQMPYPVRKATKQAFPGLYL